MADEPTPREIGYYAAIAQIGFEMFLPAVGGYYLDLWLETSPWFLILGAIFGFAAALMHLVYILKQKERDERNQKKPPP